MSHYPKFLIKLQAVLFLHGFLNNLVYFSALICPFSTKLFLCLHDFLLTQLFFQSLKKQCKQRTPCNLFWKRPYYIFKIFFGDFAGNSKSVQLSNCRERCPLYNWVLICDGLLAASSALLRTSSWHQGW